MHDLSAIVAEHSSAVWRTVYRLLDNHEDALDCHQETFLAALRLVESQDVRHWRTLLLRIATRKAIDRLRQRYKAERAINLDLAERATPEEPATRVEQAELREQVRRALGALPAQQAEAFWLRHIEQQTPQAIAEIMDLEPGHVRVLIHRAAAALRALLGPSLGHTTLSEESP